MDPKLRKFLESRGLDKEADEKEAWKFLQTLDSEKNVRSKIDTETKKPKKVEKTEEPKDPSNKRSDPDPEKIAQDVLVKERERVEGVRGLCEKFGANSIVDELIRSGASVEDAKDKVLAIVEARMQQPQDMLHRGPATMGEDARDKFRNAAVDSLLVRIGQAPEPEKRAIGYDELTGFSLKELARESLRMAGQSTKGRAIEMVGRALTTADLPYIMANVANKSLSRGWETAPETWRQWVPTGQFNDFKQHSMVRASEASDLDEVPEHGEYRYGKRAEQREVFTPATYGKLFSISRQAIINDDTGALSNIPRDHGMAASRKVADVVYAVLTANAAMGDGLALFVAGHSNYVASGSGAAPGQATIAAGVLAMGTQKDIQGLARLNIRPEFFIAPKALEGGAEVFFNSFQFSDSDTIATDSSLAATRYNVYSGTYFTRVYESRLDDALATGWYLAAGMQTEMTVKVFFLDGVEAPYLEEKQGWNVDGVEYKVRIDAVAKALDWRGLYFNYGA